METFVSTKTLFPEPYVSNKPIYQKPIHTYGPSGIDTHIPKNCFPKKSPWHQTTVLCGNKKPGVEPPRLDGQDELCYKKKLRFTGPVTPGSTIYLAEWVPHDFLKSSPVVRTNPGGRGSSRQAAIGNAVEPRCNDTGRTSRIVERTQQLMIITKEIAVKINKIVNCLEILSTRGCLVTTKNPYNGSLMNYIFNLKKTQ